MKKDNPFTLTFGRQPSEYIVRYEAMDAIISTFTSSHAVSQTYLIEGVRGSGKTVLMTSIAKELLSYGSWIVVDLNATRNLLDDLAMRLSNQSHAKPDPLHSGFTVSIAGVGVGLGADAAARDSISMIENLLAQAQKQQKKVLITIDEVLPNQGMRTFASEFQLFIRKEYPVYLLMTGLYENIDVIQNDPSLTFLLRAPKVRLDALSIHQIIKQYQRVFHIDQPLAKQLAGITKGYAFAFQALGLLYYEYADTLSLEDILLKLDDMLDDFVYRKIWESLSSLDRKIIIAISDASRRSQEVCEAAGLTPPTFSKYRERLIRRGLIYAPAYGMVSLCLPRFSLIAETYL